MKGTDERNTASSIFQRRDQPWTGLKNHRNNRNTFKKQVKIQHTYKTRFTQRHNDVTLKIIRSPENPNDKLLTRVRLSEEANKKQDQEVSG
jgi:hypothetical protein